MNLYNDLVEASRVRMAEWDSQGVTDLSYYGNELGGECGEVMELASPLLIFGINDITREMISDEIADVVICITNICVRLNMPIPRYAYLGPASLEHVLFGLAAHVGSAQNTIKKLERERIGMPGSRTTLEHLADNFAFAMAAVRQLAILVGINLDRAVAIKFNKTSEKVGLTTFLVVGE